MTDLTSAYALHAELIDTQQNIKDERLNLRVNRYAQQFFTLGTWIIYLLFAAAMYAAPLWVLQSFFDSNADNGLAIVVVGTFLLVFPTALALGKHVGYKAAAKRGIDPRYIGLIIAFFIASGIYLEMTSATSQQQEKAHQAVENSKSGQAIMDTVVSTSTGATAGLIGDAEYKLIACQRKLAEGKTKDCKNSQARLDALKHQAESDRQAAMQANAQAIPLKQEALEKERESHALPIAKSFAELFGSAISTGAVIAALIASLIFEISHSLTIFNEWRLRSKIDELEASFKKMKVAYFQATGKQFNVEDFRDTQVIDLDSLRKTGDTNSPLPASAFAPPRQPPTLLQRAGAAFADDLTKAQNARNTVHNALQNGANRVADAIGSTYRQELRNGSEQYRDVPLDAQLPKEPIPGATGLHSPALGSAEAIYPLQITEPDRAHTVEPETVRQTVRDRAHTVKPKQRSLYHDWLAAVAAGDCAKTVRATRQWVQKRVAGSQTERKSPTPKEIDAITQRLFARAIHDPASNITLNPDYSTGKVKYL